MKRPSLKVLIPVSIACSAFLIYISYTLAPRATQDTPSLSSTPGTAAVTSDGKTDFCLAGCPKGTPANDVIVTHHILKLSNNPVTKFADWVAYKITSDTLGSECKRIWHEDPDVSTDVTLIPSDYRDVRKFIASDRGHQAPLASLCGSPYWLEADYLTNITPQKSDLNEGAWEHLENHERNLIKQGVTDTVYSITGPLYERNMPPLPHAHVAHKVPSGYWKVITIQKKDEILQASFIMDQETPRDDNYCFHAVSLAVLQKRTAYTFFPERGRPQGLVLEKSDPSPSLMQALGCSSRQGAPTP